MTWSIGARVKRERELEALTVLNSKLFKYAISTLHLSKCYYLGALNHVLVPSILKLIKDKCSPKQKWWLQSPTPCNEQGHLQENPVIQTQSSLPLNLSRDGASTASVPVFHHLTAKKFFSSLLSCNVMAAYANMVTLCWKQHNGKMNLLNSCLITAWFRLWLGDIAILILLHYRLTLIIYLCNWMCSLNQSWENG